MAKRREDAERRARQCERLARVLRVLQLIMSRGQWDAPAIAKELECSERTVFRDLQTLTTAQVPLYFDEQCNSYRVRAGFRFTALEPHQDEQTQPAAVNAGVPASPSCSPEQLADLSLEAARRLLNDAGELVAILDRLRAALADKPGPE